MFPLSKIYGCVSFPIVNYNLNLSGTKIVLNKKKANDAYGILGVELSL